MARGRMLNKKISASKRVNDLPIEATLLYTWLISHLDCNGIFYGDAKMVKSLVVPRQNFNEKQVEKYLILMENSKNEDGVPLIYRYIVGGERFLWMPGFEGEQIGLRKDKENSEFKTPIQGDEMYDRLTELLRKYDGNNSDRSRKKSPLREEKRIEENKKRIEENSDDGNFPQKNNDFSSIITAYEENIGMPTGIIADKVKLTMVEYPVSWIIQAIKKSVALEKRSWAYVEGILKGWKRDGYDPLTENNHNGINATKSTKPDKDPYWG